MEDLATDGRWPMLSARVGELGARSMVCFQLFVTGNTLGSLNVLASDPGVFSDDSERVGLLFASHAAIALADAQELEHVRWALTNRDVIGQAKGILMERFRSPLMKRSLCWPRPVSRPTARSIWWPPSWPEPATSPGADAHKLVRRPFAASGRPVRHSRSTIPTDRSSGRGPPTRARSAAQTATCRCKSHPRRNLWAVS